MSTIRAIRAAAALALFAAVSVMAPTMPAASARPSPVAELRGEAVPLAPASATPATPRTNRPSRLPRWRDDFTGRAGTLPNSRWWNLETGGHGWGNNELQYYTADPANVSQDGRGHLVITALPDDGRHTCWYGPCRYTSARLTTEHKVTARSGKVEARIALPSGRGLWPAFWMMGENLRTVPWPYAGEVDIMEWVSTWPDEVWSSVHGPGYTRTGLTGAARVPSGQSFAGRFRTYAMTWTPTGLAFSIDGVVHYRVNRDQIGSGNDWVFDKPMFALLNLAVGGDWPRDPGPETPFPARLIVDYVAFTG